MKSEIYILTIIKIAFQDKFLEKPKIYHLDMNMETFYDIGSTDLRELWESDLDPVSRLFMSPTYDSYAF